MRTDGQQHDEDRVWERIDWAKHFPQTAEELAAARRNLADAHQDLTELRQQYNDLMPGWQFPVFTALFWIVVLVLVSGLVWAFSP
jgi:hypothetical protein